MRVAVVAVKHVPIGGLALPVRNGVLTRDGVSHGLDPLNEVALEWTIRQRESGHLDRVVAITMGPSDAETTLRQSLALGADEAILVSDPALQGADVRLTARAIGAVARQVGAELVVLGYESLDSSSGAVPGALATVLGWPLVSRMSDGDLTQAHLRATRDLGSGQEDVEANLPTVISIVEGMVTPRYPKLKDMMAAKTVSISALTADDLSISPSARNEVTLQIDAVDQPKKRARQVDLETGVAELFELLTGVSE